jgi:hypothetical protein
MHYKAPDNSLHFIEPEYAHWLPAGSVPITDEEAKALRPKPTAPTYQELRAPLYPPYQDYLDGVVKGDQAQIQKYIDDCLAVKALIPKA